MKTFLNKHKQLILECFIFACVLIIILIVLKYCKITLGFTKGDFAKQHVIFIDYLRNYFWKTHDLFPQITFNHGSSQSMANLFYHGQYNPLIMLSYLFPFIKTMYWLQIMYFIICLSTFASMNILLRRFDIKRSIVLVISIMIVFSPALINHFSHHIMFVYYFPVMIISLISLDILIKDNKKWPFIICVALIFYTNFFFAFIIGFMQLLFFISCLLYRYTLDKKEKIIRIRSLIISYFIGLLIGMLSFLPQVFVALTSNRVTSGYDLKLINLSHVFDNTINTYSSGLGVIVIFVLILACVNFKNKFVRLIAVGLLATIFLDHLNYLLNFFLYVHYKIFIYIIPLVFLLLAILLNDDKVKYKKLSLTLATLIVIHLYCVSYFFNNLNLYTMITDNDFLVALVLQVIILLLLILKRYQSRLMFILPLTILFVCANIGWSAKIVTHKSFNTMIINKTKIKKDFYNNEISGFYRVLNPLNHTSAINEYSPVIYTSIVNSDYIYFLYDILDLELKSGNERQFDNNTFSNSLMKKLFGIKYNYDNIDQDSEQIEVRPFIYGVEKKNTSNLNSLLTLNSAERLVALNQSFFTKDSANIFKQKNNIQKFYESKDNLEFKTKGKIRVNIPKNFQKKGVVIIETNVISDKVYKAKVSVKKHITTIRPTNFYKHAERRDVSLYYDINEDIEYLDVVFKGSNNLYSPLKASFIDYDDIKSTSLEYITPTNQVVDYNKSYNFTLDMPTSGYLGTSIFYDDGYIIKDNGKIIPKEKVNASFLGAKVSAGKHNITIEYEMKGFKEGLVLTIIGLFALGLIMVKEIKFLNRPFFKFVIVGAFNTINYFIAYTILLMMIPYLIAHVSAFIYSAVISYFLTTYYTFNTKPSFKTFLAFPLTFLPNLIISSLATAFLIETGTLDKSIASLVIMILIIPITFIINKLIFLTRPK